MANIISFKSDTEIASVLAQWIAEERLAQNLTQQDIYQRANIASSTYKKFEQTGEISLVRFIAVLRAVGRLDILEQLLSNKPSVSPMEKLTGKQLTPRKRASRK